MQQISSIELFSRFRPGATDEATISSLLRNFIEHGSLQYGDKLPPERSLAEKFGVTRASIRKAISSLVNDGLLARRRGDGTYIAKRFFATSRADELECAKRAFREIMELRCIFEPQIAELACQRRTEKQLDALKIITCDQQRRLLTGQDDGDLDARFHYAFAQCCGNYMLAEIMKWINQMYNFSRAANLRDYKWRQFSVNTHLRIIDALERRSVKECRTAVEEHLEVVLREHPYSKQNTS